MSFSCGKQNFGYFAQSRTGTNEDLLKDRCWFAGLSTTLLTLRPILASVAFNGPTKQSKVIERESCVSGIVRSYNGKGPVRTLQKSW